MIIEENTAQKTPPILDEKDLQISALKQENSWLKEQIQSLNRLVFGSKKIKLVPDNNNILYLPGFEPENIQPTQPASKEAEKPVKEHFRKKAVRNDKHSLQIPDDCPVERIVQDLPEEQKIDPKTGERLVKIGEEVTRKLAHRAAGYFVIETIRYKYAFPSKDEKGIVVPELAETILPKSRADESLLAEIIVRKYADHLPLYRLSEIFSRDGVQISRQLLSQWIIQLGLTLKPLYNLMWSRILASGNCFIDETPLKLQVKGKGKLQTGYMWLLVGGKEADPPYRIYRFFNNRAHQHALEMVKDFSGSLHSDKLEVYQKLGRQPNIVWHPCWEHAKRKFLEMESGDIPFRDWIVAQIQSLALIERDVWQLEETERVAVRQQKETPIIDEIIAAVKERVEKGFSLPKSKYREALNYIYGLIPYLKNYLNHPYAHMDNNVAERAIRPLAIGRKNWLFVGSERGGEASAILFSLVQTCRALDVNPRDYFEDMMRRFMSHPVNRLEELLPDNWAKNHLLQSNSKPLYKR